MKRAAALFRAPALSCVFYFNRFSRHFYVACRSSRLQCFSAERQESMLHFTPEQKKVKPLCRNATMHFINKKIKKQQLAKT